MSHLLGVAGFALLPPGVLALWWRRAGHRGDRAAGAAVVATALGAGGVLPSAARSSSGCTPSGWRRCDASLAGLAAQVRSGPGAWVVGAGLVLLAVAGVLCS